ncbi:enoyl-CoA hydratase-related protein [Paraburkholderia saeva]|uniref:enoyl-CoA hydratase-related protein n=1 Tax=Paraburkholderia saeva TaxID=2777537 RepID=UPI001E43C6CF|nr:enoyl-CoA hydratase-related protein [Paraburkholderia saeva]
MSLTLARPERRNALTLGMYRALADALTAATHDSQIKVVLLTGADGYFTAGNDLADFIDYRKGGEFVALTFLHALAACKKPIVAAVERGAIGVGATLLQHCDFVYAGRSTRFSLPFINFGLSVEGGTSLALGRGPLARQVTRWLMLGEPFSAEEALAAGLVTEVLDDDATFAAAQTTAARLAAMPSEPLQRTKVLLQKARGPMHETLAEEIDHFTSLLQGEFAQAQLRRFTSKGK